MAARKGFNLQRISEAFQNCSKIVFVSAFVFLSGCTTNLRGGLNSALSTILPSSLITAGIPTALTLNSPVSSPGALASPIIQVSGVSAGDTVKVFSDACVTSVGSAISAGATANVTVAPLAAGTYTFYANTTNSSGSTSACTLVTLSYTYQVVPVITLTRDTFNFSAAGTTVGQAITLTRDAPGLTNAVTLTSDSITAGSTQVTLGTQTITFNPGDTTITVLPASFTPVTAANPQGDNFFRIKISAPTNTAVLGTTTEAIVNLLDDQLTENYFFEKPLYSAVETDGNASILIGRSGSTVAVASVQVTFIDGTAVAGTDYTNTPVTVTFAAGAAEATALVPVISRGGYQANRSFFIELNSPSAGTTNRAWATAKVRILDTADPAVCDNTNNNVGVNLGFGGGAGTSGNPYLICSITQLFKVRNNLSKFYRVTADLDLDPSIDADSATGGIQPLSPVTGTLTGGFNGDEHILKNFRYTASYTANPLALFDSVGGNANVLITGINLIQSTITNSNVAGHTAGIVGQTNGRVDTLSNNMFSGYLATTGGNVGGLLMQSTGLFATPMIHNFTHGLAVGADSGGMYAGLYNWTVNGDLDHCYSTMNIQGGGATGGLIGGVQFVQQTTESITNSHSKGTIIATGIHSENSAGGLAGILAGNGTVTMLVSNSYSTSKIYSADDAGSLIGSYYCPVTSTCGVSNSYATGTVTDITGGYIGGLIGYVTSTGTNFTIDHVYATGNITGAADAQAGGLIGRFEGASSSNTFSLTNSYATGNVASQNSTGGLIGSIFTSAGSGSTYTFNNNYATGTVATTIDHTGAGGLVGAINESDADGVSTILIENSYASGNVNAPSYTGGVIGVYAGYSTGGSTFTLSNVYSTGNVTATSDYVGGIVGMFFTGAGNAPINDTVTGCYSTGTVASSGGDDVGGGIGYFWMDGTNGSMNVDTSYATGNVSGVNNVGGFIGEATAQSGNPSSMTLTKIHATGSVTGSGSHAGGLLGQFDCETNITQPMILQKSYATGNVSAHDTVGGLIGNADVNFNSCSMTVQNNFATGTVAATTTQVGGLIGEGSGTAATPLVLTNNFTLASSITGTAPKGLIGVATHATLTAGTNFWLKDAGINAAIANDGNQQTAAALQTLGTYPGGYDFVGIWNSPGAGVYPTLK